MLGNQIGTDDGRFTYIDLFSGCGGLSLGLRRAGGELLLAVEKSDMAARTYAYNFLKFGEDDKEWFSYLNKNIVEQSRSKLIVQPLRNLLDSAETMSSFNTANVDLIAGGPPCQGFSLAGKRNPDDLRNKLAWEFLEMVEQVSPKMVLIENVVGMSHTFVPGKSSSFEELQEALRETGPGYFVRGLAVNAMHFGAAQHRPRMMIIGIRKDLSNNFRSIDGSFWRSNFADLLEKSSDRVIPKTIPASELRTVRDAIGDLQFDSEASENSSNSRKFLQEMQSVERWNLEAPKNPLDEPQNHKRRSHAEKTISRFRIYQWLAHEGLSSRMLSIESKQELIQAMGGSQFPATSPDGFQLASTVEEMAELVVQHRTKKHSQSALSWDSVARTVVTLPDDYVHPSEPRIFTVRELARFQGFPDDFIFLGKETTGSDRRKFEVPQYSQVGNAVSPFLGLAMGELVAETLASL